MSNQDWLVTNEGSWQGQPLQTAAPRSQDYRLYRFLTDVEDILAAVPDNQERLIQMFPLVRQLLDQSAWLRFAIAPPDPETGWSVNTLYDEPGFPLTVQTVVWRPGQVSKIHNHGTWGIVALMDGEEKNVLWRRPNQDPTGPQNRLEQTGDLVLNPGDLIGLMPDAIHCVEAMGEEPTVSFNLYGVADYENRWKFDPQSHAAELF